jgi:uncharacterized protein
MTEENRRRNLRDEVERADQALRAAQALLDVGLHADSVSRAYYAAYPLLRALLLSRGMEPRSHSGAIHLFNTEFVRPGLLPSSHNRLLGGLQRARELADYDPAVAFSAEDAAMNLEDARSFAREVLELLAREGWLAPGSGA